VVVLRIDVSKEFIAIIRGEKNQGARNNVSSNYRPNYAAKKYYGIFLRSVHPLLVSANVVPSSVIRVTLMMVVLHSFETSVLTTATRRNIPEDDILHSHCRENLKSYIALTGWTL
jgi:hypothetical protein